VTAVEHALMSHWVILFCLG